MKLKIESAFGILLITLTLCTGTSASPLKDRQNGWPCGELPKVWRNKKGEPVWLSATTLNRRVVNRSEPKLPSSVRLEGKIIAEVLIGRDGVVRCVRVRKGHPILRRAVEDALKEWTFKPIILKGGPVAVFGFLEFQFSN